jgi:Cu2+-exporting ATPase
VEVTAFGKSSRIGRVMQAVETAATEKTPLVQLADRIGGVFIVVVLLLAVLTFAIWLPRSLDQAISFGTAMLIVACPCALAMATPLAIAVGIGRAARAQILIRDGTALQHLAKPGMLWLDKTGTLTEGRQHARLVWGDPRIVSLAGALESQCQHPIARAVAALACSNSVATAAGELELNDLNNNQPAVSELNLLAGGVRGCVEARNVVVGNAQLIQSLSIAIPQHLQKMAQSLASHGETPIFIAVDNNVEGLLGLADPIRPQASQLIKAARQMRWDVGIMSGDLPEIVDRVGREVGLPPNLCHGGVSPEEKLSMIRQSRQQYSTVVMIGDGANDAAALAAADVGIAVRGGAEVSLHAAPVFLANNQLLNIARLLRGSKTTMRVIYFNFAVSLVYNLIAVGLALAGLISPLLAAIIMPLSSVTVLGLTFLIPSFSANKSLLTQAEVAS